MKRAAISIRVTGLAIAAWLAAAAAPAFARGQPQLPDDDGGRAGVLRALNPDFDPHRAALDLRPASRHAAPISRAPSAIPRADNSALAAR
ncbi:hypothetical protein BCCR75502_06875 [Burkholderia sola]|uniref:Uncharacterized protein n=1 Tax=Burkholderia sola TaxID=2843302 RepID=A0ABV2CGM2_9BURK|nr:MULTISPECIES: hypothetical protein [Burkholderia]KWU20818.1 hypothetical protein AS149_39310 [Burkholderia cenocepacia]MBP0610301.1 hypothetical protein [Burkholderia sp. CpTa8-5]MBP0718033.1 hypothetical protein [Burkholderia sp. AcTa6-5]OXI65962.1 hypothetical protein CFB44_33415 [Burkholderia sp. AU31280]RQU78349.1 hypothetical protein DF133_35605 [Burkholderia cenocepacia]